MTAAYVEDVLGAETETPSDDHAGGFVHFSDSPVRVGWVGGYGDPSKPGSMPERYAPFVFPVDLDSPTSAQMAAAWEALVNTMKPGFLTAEREIVRVVFEGELALFRVVDLRAFADTLMFQVHD